MQTLSKRSIARLSPLFLKHSQFLGQSTDVDIDCLKGDMNMSD